MPVSFYTVQTIVVVIQVSLELKESNQLVCPMFSQWSFADLVLHIWRLLQERSHVVLPVSDIQFSIDITGTKPRSGNIFGWQMEALCTSVFSLNFNIWLSALQRP